MPVAVIIPALNEELAIAKVIHALPKEAVHEVIVVDNGSVDMTAQHASQAGAHVVREDKRGYGAACLKGIAALSREADIVVFLDGDYSDYPHELDKIVAPILQDGYDMVIGSRLAYRANARLLPQANRLGNRLACFWLRVFFNARYTDLGPFRAIRRRALQELQMEDTDFGWTIEMQIKAALKRLKVKEVAVGYRNRLGTPKITGTLKGSLQACLKITSTLVRYKILQLTGRISHA